jgi:predicted nucleic acid-binding protein
MYLVDTDVVSEARKQSKADPGVRAFLRKAARSRDPLYLSVITVGELRHGIERIRGRGGIRQAGRLEGWLDSILDVYPDQILGIGSDVAQLWGALSLPAAASVIDRQIAATARIHDLTLVTRKAAAFSGSGVPVFNPFSRRQRT